MSVVSAPLLMVVDEIGCVRITLHGGMLRCEYHRCERTSTVLNPNKSFEE
jgi:hypothetical protein